MIHSLVNSNKYHEKIETRIVKYIYFFLLEEEEEEEAVNITLFIRILYIYIYINSFNSLHIYLDKSKGAPKEVGTMSLKLSSKEYSE